MIRKIEHYTDFILTQEFARKRLEENSITVTWFTNHENTRSIVHSHPYYEAVFAVSGYDVAYSADGDLYQLRCGEVILFPCELYHAAKYDCGSQYSERIVVQIDSEFWKATASLLGLEHAEWNHTVTVFDANAVKAWDMRGLFERMNLNAALDEEYRTAAFTGNLSEFFMIICQIAKKGNVYAPTATSSLVERAVLYIQENYTDPKLNVARLMSYTYTSRGHLSRMFKAYTAESIHSYITDLRMQHCCQAIADGRSILDACTESGFSDYSSFLKAFRKLYGMTPVMYRTKLREMNLRNS